jgi:hypothetical protein
MRVSRQEWAAIGLLAAGSVAVWLVVGSYPAYDAYYHLVWGRELFVGQVPSIGDYQAPTAHPLYILIAGLLGLIFGEGADRALVLFSILSMSLCAWALWRIGRVVFGVWPGVIAALLVLSNLTLLLYGVRAFPDLIFLALVFLAAALEAEQPRRGAAVMVTLFAAGLVRPEAWVLAGIYWLWCIWPRDPSSGRRSLHLGLLALVVGAPLLWALFDWWTVSQPLYALTETSSLAAELGRRRGIAEVPSAFIDGLIGVLRAPLLALVLVGVGLQVARRRAEHLYLPMTLITVGIVTFVLVGIFGLSLLPRYLTIPSITLLLFAGYALAGWVELAKSTSLRRGWALVAAVVVIAGVALTVGRASLFTRASDEISFVNGVHADLVATLADPAVTAARRCGPVSLPNFGLVPDTRWALDASGNQVISRSDRSSRSGVALVLTDDKTRNRYGRADGVEVNTDSAPQGFRLIAEHGRIAAWGSCR